MEREIKELYYFNPADYDENGRKIDDGKTFREAVKEFERNFHTLHRSDYALNLYANSQTMNLLARSCGADERMIYGMDLTQGHSFDPEKDPYINHEMDKHSQHIFVYGIDSAFMSHYDENGYPVFDEDDAYPLTLLVDANMRDGELRLSVPTIDGDEDEMSDIVVGTPKFEFV